MGADPLLRAVREQLAFGGVLPLGDAADGAWLTERAAAGTLRRAAAALPETRLLDVRLALADPAAAERAAVPPPPSALPPGPLRIAADCSVGLGDAGWAAGALSLPERAELLRERLATAARGRLGLRVSEVDVRVVELLDAPARRPLPERPRRAEGHAGPAGANGAAGADGVDGAAGADGADRADSVAGPDGPAAARPPRPGAEAAVAAAVLAVPGVRGLCAGFGGQPRGLCVTDRAPDAEAPRREVAVHLVVGAERRVLDVARAASEAAAKAATTDAPGPVAVTVLVAEVSQAPGRRGPHPAA